MNEPPKKGAAPAKEAACSGEHTYLFSSPCKTQESALAELCKAYMRTSLTDRRLFLADIRAGAPNLWREIDREEKGGSSR